MLDELQLIEDCKQGSNSAFEKLYVKYAPKMKGIAYRYVGDRMKAEDIVHDAFIKVYEKISSLKDNAVFGGWLRRIVVNQALDALKSEKKLKTISEESLQFNSEEPSDDKGIYENISAKQLMDTLASLPTGYKTIFNLYVVDGFQHKEIAEQLGISEGTSKSQLAKAKIYLRKLLIEKCVLND